MRIRWTPMLPHMQGVHSAFIFTFLYVMLYLYEMSYHVLVLTVLQGPFLSVKYHCFLSVIDWYVLPDSKDKIMTLYIRRVQHRKRRQVSSTELTGSVQVDKKKGQESRRNEITEVINNILLLWSLFLSHFNDVYFESLQEVVSESGDARKRRKRKDTNEVIEVSEKSIPQSTQRYACRVY
jgi:hypothetical protein